MTRYVFPVVGVVLSWETSSSVLLKGRPSGLVTSLECIQAGPGSGRKEAMSQGQAATESEVGC